MRFAPAVKNSYAGTVNLLNAVNVATIDTHARGALRRMLVKIAGIANIALPNVNTARRQDVIVISINVKCVNKKAALYAMICLTVGNAKGLYVKIATVQNHVVNVRRSGVSIASCKMGKMILNA